MLTRLSLATLLLLSVGACAPELNGSGNQPSCGESCDNHEGGGQELAIVAGETQNWYRCWVEEDLDVTDEVFRRDQVVCAMTEQGRALDLQYVAIQMMTAEDRISEVLLRPEEDLAIVSYVNGPAYPLNIDVSVKLTNFDSDVDYLGFTDGNYRFSHQISQDDLPTEEQPLAGHQPFDLWPVELSAETRIVSLRFDSYSLDLSGGVEFSQGNSIESGEQVEVGLVKVDVRDGNTKSFFLPVTPGREAALSGNGQFYRESMPFSVSGPGQYIGDDQGLRARE